MSKEPQSMHHEGVYQKRGSRLLVMALIVLMASVAFQIVAATSHLAIFLWLNWLALIVFVVLEISAAMTLRRLRVRRQRKAREKEQQATM